MSVSLLFRPDAEKHAERKYTRFTVDAKPNVAPTSSAMASWENAVLTEMRRVGHLFIQEKEREGWRYLGRGLDLSGPYAHLDVTKGIPKRPNIPKRKPGEPSLPAYKLDQTDWDYYTQNIPIDKHEREKWDYGLSGLFAVSTLTEFLQEAVSA